MTQRFTRLGEDGVPQGTIVTGAYAAPYREPLIIVSRAALLAEWASSISKRVNLEERSFDMDIQFCQQGDIGLPLVIQLEDQNGNFANLSGATGLTVLLQFPDGMMVSRTASFLTDGSDGRITYVTQNGDLDQSGYYSVQPKFTLGSSIISGEVQVLSVAPNVAAQQIEPIPDSHSKAFTQADLVAGVLTIHHYKGLSAPYSIQVSIFNQLGQQVTPDSVTGSANSVAVDLSSFAPISGLWGYIYI